MTLAGLRRLVEVGSLGPELPAVTVTDELARWWAEGADRRPDVEELEYAATLQAAASSLELLDADAVAAGTEPARRVVLAAEVDAVRTLGDVDLGGAAPGAGTLPGELLIADVVAVLVDTPDASAAVRAAVAALADDAAPSAHVQRVLTDLVEHDLAWYAPVEAAELVQTSGG